MLGSTILDVIIGVIFVFLVLSLLCSVIIEMVSALLALRARTLEEGIRTLLDDLETGELTKRVYEHPLIKGMSRANRPGPDRNKPAYIGSRTFATVLLDVLVDAVVPEAPYSKPRLLQEIGSIVSLLPAEYDTVKRALLALIDQAEGDIAKVRASIETWFDDAMTRVSGWYKRRVQRIGLAVAATLCVLMNADLTMIAGMLYQDSATRMTLVAVASETTRQSNATQPPADMLTRINDLLDRSANVRLPLGWAGVDGQPEMPDDPRRVPATIELWLLKIAGVTLTVVAVTFGAPFWFSVLKSVMSLRLDGDPPPK